MKTSSRLLMVAIALINASAVNAATCDSSCLRAVTDSYLAALLKHAPQAVKTAADVKFTENGKPGKLGDGLWKGATSLGTYQQFLEDPATQQAMFIGVVNEGAAPTITSLRLGVVDGKVREVEHIVARKGSHVLFAPEVFVKPNPVLSQPVTKALSRAELVKIADSYLEGLQLHDSKVILAAPVCERIENGVQTTNRPNGRPGNCASSADVLTYIKAVKNRRFPVVDPLHGIVVSTIVFDIPGGDALPTGGVREPRMLLLTEWFKIDDGRISHIEAIMHNLPYGQGSGW